MNIVRYHDVMFRGETLHDAWIDECAAYLRTVFGDVSGKVVVDYAFGRGNWSLAFQRLGARKVIAVDASQKAVEQFYSFLRANEITGIEVVCGNTDEEELPLEVDIVFAYGILQHLERPDLFLRQASGWLNDANSQLLVYAYDAGGWREILLNLSRRVPISRFEALGKWEFLMHPLARHRAVDDLYAPVVTFWSPEKLQNLLSASGLAVTGQVKDFADFQNKSLAPEFDPYVILAARADSETSSLPIVPNEQPLKAECALIGEFLEALLAEDIPVDNAAVIIGAFNAVFPSSLKMSLEDRLFYLWVHLCGLVSKFQGEIALNGVSRELSQALHLTIRRDKDVSILGDEALKCGVLIRKILNESYRM